MIIFGLKSFVKTLAMLTLVCGRCGNPAAHRLVQRSRWFSLFFVPVIPLSFSRYTTCTFCGATHKVSKPDAQHMVATAGAAQPAAMPQPPAGAQPAQPGMPATAAPQQVHPPQS